ncbi:hypothetical protein M9H77_03313 [Catharanthus roseus]|uniref:Uncharacterized protein n=1 Tax=Catharanthus roseus TaxID=4058 RepID=A0ACC0CAX8_CATRO|nr:hypothetical protein M9H77_03313 [Catharanthus roseus]
MFGSIIKCSVGILLVGLDHQARIQTMHRSRVPYRCGIFKTVYNCCEAGFGRRKRIALYVASLPYQSLFQWHERFRLERVDPLEEGCRTVESVAQSVYVDTTSCSEVGRSPCGEPGGA